MRPMIRSYATIVINSLVLLTIASGIISYLYSGPYIDPTQPTPTPSCLDYTYHHCNSNSNSSSSSFTPTTNVTCAAPSEARKEFTNWRALVIGFGWFCFSFSLYVLIRDILVVSGKSNILWTYGPFKKAIGLPPMIEKLTFWILGSIIDHSIGVRIILLILAFPLLVLYFLVIGFGSLVNKFIYSFLHPCRMSHLCSVVSLILMLGFCFGTFIGGVTIMVFGATNFGTRVSSTCICYCYYKQTLKDNLTMIGLITVTMIKAVLALKTLYNGAGFVYSVTHNVPHRVAEQLNKTDPAHNLFELQIADDYELVV